MFSRSMFFSGQVFQGLDPCFRSSLTKLHFKKIQVQIQLYKKYNIPIYVIITLFVYFSLKTF